MNSLPNPEATSAAYRWRPLRRAIAWERAIGTRAAGHPASAAIYEFVRFGVKQAWACLFGALMLALLVSTHFLYPSTAWLARYDFLVLAAVGVQIAMIAWRFETIEEAKVILIFHVVGTGMEVFKTSVGSWMYPEASLLRLGGVPLFTGFMYAAIGSYIARCWRLFDFRFSHHPSALVLSVVALAIYVNFFAHHYLPDGRFVLFGAVGVLFARCWIYFKVWRVHRSMPLLVGFALVALFIWFAENIGTFASAWVYPHQRRVWEMVGTAKLGSWFLLMIISYWLVALVNGISEMKRSGRMVADPTGALGSPRV